MAVIAIKHLKCCKCILFVLHNTFNFIAQCRQTKIHSRNMNCCKLSCGVMVVYTVQISNLTVSVNQTL